MTPTRVAILGGGISGLAAAYFLAERGKNVTLFETTDQLGGLGTFFSHDGYFHERFYHCMLPSDGPLLNLLGKIGVANQVYWKPSQFGILANGRLYGLNSAIDLLKFNLVSFVDRLRIGLTGLYGKFCSDKGLDDVSAEAWLTKLSGKNAFAAFWRPLLQAKFGDRYRDVPALWFWSRFNREKAKGPERKGYIRGGYKTIIDALVLALEKKGVVIRKNAAISKVSRSQNGNILVVLNGSNDEFDQVLLTTPHSVVEGLLDRESLGPTTAKVSTDIESQGVVNVLFFLRQSISSYYWIATPEDSIPFQGVVESSNLMEPEERHGLHLAYVMNYVHRSDPLFSRPEVDLLKEYSVALRRLFPKLQESDFVASYVFRAPFVEPVYFRGYLSKKPPVELLPGKIFLSCTAQVYPEVTSWNGAVGLVEKAVARMCGQ